MISRKEIAIVLTMIALLAVVWAAVNHVDVAQGAAQTQFVYDAVHNAALTCYAVEGAYPDTLNYLRENYGLAYDESRYLVHYDAFASNLIPTITVVEMEGGR